MLMTSGLATFASARNLWAFLPDHYMRFRDGFAEAMDERLYTIEYLDEIIEHRRGWCIAADDAAIVFEVKVYPTGARVVHGLVATGDLERIIDTLIPAAEQWGRENGCIAALIESRPAWAKLLKPHGYEAHQLSVWKDL